MGGGFPFTYSKIVFAGIYAGTFGKGLKMGVLRKKRFFLKISYFNKRGKRPQHQLLNFPARLNPYLNWKLEKSLCAGKPASSALEIG
jgi:hypothetical protein